MTSPAPFISAPMSVEEAWLDYNGHMNMAYYNVLFDRCCDQVFDQIGIGAAYAKNRRLTIYTAEIHLCYVRELHLGDQVKVSFQLLDADAKRIHGYQEIHHADGWLSATCEVLSLHVDMEGPKVASFPPDIQEKIDAMKAGHGALPWPERAGRSIGIKRKG